MQALDGNAIAGDLFASFGREMTTVAGTCRRCGAVSVVAELRVYVHPSAAVARCPGCAAVVMVLVTSGGETRTRLPAFTLSVAS
jgi:hypothetical protein